MKLMRFTKRAKNKTKGAFTFRYTHLYHVWALQRMPKNVTLGDQTDKCHATVYSTCCFLAHGRRNEITAGMKSLSKTNTEYCRQIAMY